MICASPTETASDTHETIRTFSNTIDPITSAPLLNGDKMDQLTIGIQLFYRDIFPNKIFLPGNR